jgi:hypothetical protein
LQAEPQAQGIALLLSPVEAVAETTCWVVLFIGCFLDEVMGRGALYPAMVARN